MKIIYFILAAVTELTLAVPSLDWIDAVIIDNYNDPFEDSHKIQVIGSPKKDDEPVPPPPPVDQAAKYARYIVHYSLWGTLAHISLQPNNTGYPLGRVYSMSDGPINRGSGVPYFYMTFRDPEMIDILKDSRASFTSTLAQSSFCRAQSLDPEDPRCSQVILQGKFVFIPNGTVEWDIAKNAMFTRHPVMKNWPMTHDWLFAKLDINRICLVNFFGGNKYPSVEAYFKADPILYAEDNPFLEMSFF